MASEREQRMLAASRTARWAWLRRVREGGLNSSQRVLTPKSFRQHRASHSVTYTSAFRSYVAVQII